MKQTRRGRPDNRLHEIASEFRGRIFRGDWLPGARLPTRRQLSAEFAASPVTIQQILDELERDGFTRADGSNGTFLSDSPPHLVNVALVFPANPSQNLLWLALFREALKEQPDGLRVTPWCNINFNGLSDSPEQTGLLSEIQRRRLLGIFFASVPSLVDKTPVLTEPGVPRCAIMSPGPYPEIPKIGFDNVSFQIKALDFLKSKGRTRVAVVGNCDISKTDWLQRIADAGLACGHHWMQGMSLVDTLPGVNLARLLLRGDPEERPDALVIADDNLVESITRGVAESGLELPRDLDIVAHCNFPCLPSAAVPVTWLGYDVRRVLHAGIRSLHALRRGETPTQYETVDALFEEEAHKDLKDQA